MIHPGKVTLPLPHLYISLFYSLFPPFKGGTLILKVSKRGKLKKILGRRNQKGGEILSKRKGEPTFSIKFRDRKGQKWGLLETN